MDRALYEDDFYLWTQAQAQALLAEGLRSRSNAVDWELVAEEVRDLGGSQLRECESRTRTIIENLYKLAWSQMDAPRNGWRTTIRTQRADLQIALTTAIEKLVQSRLEYLHGVAGKIASAEFADTEPQTPVDSALRWAWAQITGENGHDPLS